MKKLESNHDLSFVNNFSFSSQFSSGIEYCRYEQQIDLSISSFSEEKQKTAFTLKIKQILAKWKQWIISCYCPQVKYREHQLVEKSQLLLKKISTETAWVSSLLALASVGMVSEMAPIWSEVNQNLSLTLPLLNKAIRVPNSAEQLFPLLAIEEIELITWGRNDVNNLQSTKRNQQEWLMYQTKANGSLMAIPPLHNQPSLAGFPSFLSTLDFVNIQKDSHLNRFNLINQNNLLSSPLDSVTYNIEDKLMATPRTVYKPHIPKVNFLEHS